MKKIAHHLLSTPITAICWTIGIFLGCSRPGKDLPKLHLFDNFDKVVHFIFFFVFAYLWAVVGKSTFRILAITLLISIAYGTFIEYYQKNFVAGRSFDVWDIVADSLGALVAVLLLKYYKPTTTV
jgi:VanZ family protein